MSEGSSSQKKFFRSERPQVVIARPDPPQKKAVQSKPKNSNGDKHQDRNSLNSSSISRKDDTTESTASSLAKKDQKHQNDAGAIGAAQSHKDSVMGKQNGEVVPSEVASKKVKEGRLKVSKVQNQDEDSSSSDTPAAKPVKRRAPPKKRPKSNAVTGNKLTDNPSSRVLQERATRNDSESTLDESDSDFSEEEMRNFGKQVNNLMVQLGSKIENRIRVRTEKLTNAFEGVMSLPSKIAKFELDQHKQQQVIVQDFQTAFAKITDKLQEVVKLQAKNVEKCSQLFDEGSAAHENSRKEIADYRQQHNSALVKYFQEEEKLRSKLADEEKQCVEQNNKEIRKLRTKLMLEDEVQSSEVLKKL